MVNKLEKIFQMLDTNGNGWISADEIDLDLVPSDILIVLKPLLMEIE